MADDLIHTEPFLFSSQEVTEGKSIPKGDPSEDEAVKWLDQFIVWLKSFVKRKIRLSLRDYCGVILRDLRV